MGSKGVFDLETHFAFYGAYHSNPVNVLIHTIFVWPIFFTSLVLLYFTPSPFRLLGFEPPFTLPSHVLFFNFGFFFALLYAGFYVLMDRKAGSLAAFLCMGCWVGSCYLANHLGSSLASKVVLGAQVLCWTGQFLGHGIFEKRAPALLDNLVQAFLMAPFFVLLEVLQMVFGYEPYPGFHSNVKEKIDAEIKVWQESKQRKMS
ncbi:hypothetical protein MLD38_031912 [Melastoma candidum]|uniref:Uncharacterized protein n=1 Tax=Melastoma candidum TaxID=119954 RepID=A0ACB9MT23_9MYRT|nr:hypothetical protein MLD38_031912 [Melastoma candidum]